MESSPATRFSLEGIDDVYDFPWQNEEGSSMSLERYAHLYDLMQRGNTAFREDRLDQAIELYSRANHIKPGDSIILSNRCAAYLRISQFLRSRSPSASEYRPLNGLDPTTHAGLALNDAEKVMNLHCNSAASYILKANALILLEKYELAQDVIRSGLQIDPQSNALSNLEKKIANTFLRRINSNPQRTDDYDCTLCLKLLFEPITTPCGHSFCRSCLFQTMDRGNRCPLCRTILFISPRTCAISVTLNNIIEKSFPEEYAERKLEQLSLTNPGPDLLPLFAMDVILPCQKLQLNIFEPRYRLMVRRIMEGNRRMGMVVIDPSTGSVVDYACEVEITDCEPLPDGRFFLEVESRRRCRIIRNWDQDGYRVAEVEWVNDTYPPEGNERNDLLEMTNKAAVFVRQWIKEAQEAAQGDRIRLAELFKAEGLMPSTSDPERFSFWLATLTNRRPSERLELLRLRDTRERITRSLLFMKAEEQGCRLIWQ
ncbi:LON peptidase N-terminal domain and RING finger protein 1 isoform X3 [Salvia hispanica]|uniref:LON peptidase N-terminal domain and RING finger protein 1 isoform X3 n=1 Tax=Salvia hispanica TaxID=49212 RepID=UPI002008F0C1|nr:LON peptidase N-terminal domain and RING finger protein 1 isoform X3 [Salvia hispanica]